MTTRPFAKKGWVFYCPLLPSYRSCRYWKKIKEDDKYVSIKIKSQLEFMSFFIP
jgi:hypothetical protein